MAERAGILTAAVGALLVVISTTVGSGFSAWAFAFIALALIPYGALALLGRFVRDPWIVGGAGAAALAVETGVRMAVFVFPRGSTAGIALVFSPLLVGVVAMPAGAALGFLSGFLFRRGGIVTRWAVVLAAVVSIGLTVIGFARPELLPTSVIARRSALAAIGEPRVAAGQEAFERVIVSDRSAWHIIGDFDGVPGDEVAVVDHTGADVLDPLTLTSRFRVTFGGPGGLWNWYSRLVHLPSGLAVARIGGGFQQTEVRTLENTPLWRYHPDPDRAPSALLPGDLDRDGELEFYAATAHHVARLTSAGTEIWRRPTCFAHLVALAPRTEKGPSWIVGSEYGRAIRVWDDGGAVLAELPWPGVPVLGVVDWPDGRAILVGDKTARGLALDGTTRFDLPLNRPMALMQAVDVEWGSGSPRLLALVTAAPRDVGRWRLTLINAERRVVYDEVLERSVQLLVARGADGQRTLLVSGGGLWVLRPIRRQLVEGPDGRGDRVRGCAASGAIPV